MIEPDLLLGIGAVMEMEASGLDFMVTACPSSLPEPERGRVLSCDIVERAVVEYVCRM